MAVVEWWIAGILGLAFGSFLNVLIVRIPKDENIAFPASHCVKCQTPLKPWHNIPLFSYLALRGKCAFCGVSISPMYPLVELASACLALAVVGKLGFGIPALFISLAFMFLLTLSLIDYRIQAVPDVINFAALFAAWLGVFSWESLESAFLIAGALTLLRFGLSSILQKEVMGEGDIILGATMGALVGMKLAFFAIFLAALLALPVLLLLGRANRRVAFIPFLALGVTLTYFLDFWILSWLGW